MMLKSLAYLLVVAFVINAKVIEKERNQIICEEEAHEKCLNKRTLRSIEKPITTLLESVENKLIADSDNVIQCENKDLVINIIKASVSNTDRTRCSKNEGLTKGENCTDSILTTIITTRLCNGNNNCTIRMNEDFSDVCECSDQKYIDIRFKCVAPSELTEEESKNLSKRYIRMNYNIDQGYGGRRGYGNERSYGKSEGYRKSRGYGNDEGYGKSQGYGKSEGYRKSEGYGKDEGYGKSKGYGKDEGYGMSKRYGKSERYGKANGYRKSERYGKDEGYGKTYAGYKQNEQHEKTQKYVKDYMKDNYNDHEDNYNHKMSSYGKYDRDSKKYSPKSKMYNQQRKSDGHRNRQRPSVGNTRSRGPVDLFYDDYLYDDYLYDYLYPDYYDYLYPDYYDYLYPDYLLDYAYYWTCFNC